MDNKLLLTNDISLSIISNYHTCTYMHITFKSWYNSFYFITLKDCLLLQVPSSFCNMKVARRSAQITWYKIVLYIHEAPTVTYICSCCGLSLSRSKERQLTFVMLEAWRRRTLYSVHLPNQQMNVIYWREEKKHHH